MEINAYLCTRKRNNMIKIPTKWELTSSIHAPVAELVDAPDLGSGVHDVQVRVLSGALFESNGQTSPKTVARNC